MVNLCVCLIYAFVCLNNESFLVLVKMLPSLIYKVRSEESTSDTSVICDLKSHPSAFLHSRVLWSPSAGVDLEVCFTCFYSLD